MYLDKRQKNIIIKALNDYKFIKEELTLKIKAQYTPDELTDYILRFKDTEITNFDDMYLDFEYQDISTCVILNSTPVPQVSSTFEIYDKIKQEYIVEDFLTPEDYEKMLKTPFEESLKEMVHELNFYDIQDMTTQYNEQKEKIIKALKEELK